MRYRGIISLVLAAMLIVSGPIQLRAENMVLKVTPYEQGTEADTGNMIFKAEETVGGLDEELPDIEDAEEELGEPSVRYVTEIPDGEIIIGGAEEAEQQTGSAYFNSGMTSRAKPTQYEIAEAVKKVVDASERFSVVPGTSSPYSLGRLTDQYQQSALTYVNYIRYLAGLDPLALNANCTSSAQYGAVLLAAYNGTLSHSPKQPADMEDSFYQKGLAGTSSSNIYSIARHNSPALTLRKSIESFMRDNGSASNLLKMGHRRWILYPQNVRVGFGQADSATKFYASMKVMSWDGDGLSRSDDPDSYASVDYDFISWPSSGCFPTDMMQVNVPWTVTVNPNRYAKPDKSKVSVSVTRIQDGKKWTFDQNDSAASPTNTQKYFEIDTAGYGVGNCIIFNFGSQFDSAGYSGVYEVAVSGLKDKSGRSASLVYRTEFFDINNPGESKIEEGGAQYDPDPGEDVIQDGSQKHCAVSFYTGLNGDIPYQVVSALSGSTVELPENPPAPEEEYVFDGWFTGKDGTGNIFNEATSVLNDISVYACFKEIQEETQGNVRSVDTLKVAKIARQVYCGEKIMPELVIKDGSTLLTENTDYMLRYRDNEAVGTATVLIEGKNGYTGTRSVTFQILPKSVAKADIWLEDQTIIGKEVSLKVHAMDTQGSLTENKDYKITQIKGSLSQQGNVTVTFAGIGNYNGTVRKTFTIHEMTAVLANPGMLTFDAENDPNYDSEAGGFVYNGKAIKPKIIVTALDGSVLSPSNYKVTYKNNKNAGLASVKVTGKRKAFRGSYTFYFRIQKRSVEELGTYQIAGKTFTGNAVRPVPVMRMSVRVNGLYKTLKLQKKRDVTLYYTKNKYAGTATVTVTGKKNFSGVKQFDFMIGERDIAKGVKIKASAGTDGVAVITLTYGKYTLREGSDYTYVLTDSDKPDRKKIEITGKGNFKGSLLKEIVVK